jgi:hypothetical protein
LEFSKERRGDYAALAGLQIVSPVGVLAAVITICLSTLLFVWTRSVPLLPVALYLMFSIKVAKHWEKLAVLRLGRYAGLRGAGMFHTSR